MANLKLHFGNLLKKHIKASKVRQFDIAEALELSPSAVSQMLSGRMTPNLRQLDVIMEKLSLDRNSCTELRDCLSRIRSGDENLRSPLNEFIKSNRTSLGLSLEQLANMTGIPEENLAMLENRLNVQPTPYEAVRLAAIFNCNISEFWQMDPQKNEAAVFEPPEENSRKVRLLRDRKQTYHVDGTTAIKTPVIKFEDLRNFDPGNDKLLDFAWRHMSGFENDHKAGLVVVKAPGNEFGWSDLYEVKLLIAETKEWIPGMSVLCCCDDELFLARATADEMMVAAMGELKPVKCQWFWLVNSFSFASELFENTSSRRGDKKSQRNVAVMRQHFSSEDAVETTDNE